MNDDNLYPTSSQFLQEPADQRKERKDTEAHIGEFMPLIKDIIARLNERIAFYDSVSSISDEVKTKPDEFMHVVVSNELTKNNLIIEKEFLENLIEDFNK